MYSISVIKFHYIFITTTFSAIALAQSLREFPHPLKSSASEDLHRRSHFLLPLPIMLLGLRQSLEGFRDYLGGRTKLPLRQLRLDQLHLLWTQSNIHYQKELVESPKPDREKLKEDYSLLQSSSFLCQVPSSGQLSSGQLNEATSLRQIHILTRALHPGRAIAPKPCLRIANPIACRCFPHTNKC